MGTGATWLAAIALGCWLIVLSYFDIRHRRLPNVLTLPGAAGILAGAALAGHGAPAAVGALAMLAVYAVIHLAAPSALGAGDVKLAIGLGALTGAFGPNAWLLAVLGASVLTAAVALVLLIGGDRSPVPHGPSMCGAASASVALTLI
ncbi:MAG: prepilin peptidase [Mycolicibacterium sp.]|uniref:prepilin peptidase n=1 Tax=Mycolicibacterium sp. TaxID=2320850 RepID=UPI003D13C723